MARGPNATGRGASKKMSDSYWDRFTRARLSRRRALAGAGALGAGAAAVGLIGCGSSSSTSSGTPSATSQGVPGDKSGLLSQPVDTRNQAKSGGKLQSLTGADVTSMDPLSSQSFSTQVVAGWTYSRLLKIVPGINTGSANDVEPDLAEKYEVSGDKMQITFTLRQNVKWDARAPTNSRPVTADDVVFSWNKFSTISPFAGILANAKNKDSSVLSMEAPDSKTVVVKLAFPDASALTMLGSSAAFYIMPKESDGQFDPKGTIRGSSAWILDAYASSQGFTYAKNPNWYRQDIPYLDKVDFPIVTEYAQQLSQLRAGNVLGGFVVKQDDLIPLKRDIPDIFMYQASWPVYWFNSWFGYAGTSPFKDKRVRQAVSMSYDRDLWISTFYVPDAFSKAGLNVPTRWHSHFPLAWDGWWVDPKDETALGGNAKNFKYDPKTAKQLLAAAGYANGFEIPAYYISSPYYGPDFQKQSEVELGFVNDIGIKTTANNPDYQTDWLNKYYYGKGNFQGFALGADTPELDPGSFMFQRFHPSGPRFKGFSPDGGDPTKGDPQVTAMIDAIRQEFDPQKRKEIAKQYQTYMADAMYAIAQPGYSQGFGVAWPAWGNAGVFRVGGEGYATGAETYVYAWLDQTKKPLAG